MTKKLSVIAIVAICSGMLQAENKIVDSSILDPLMAPPVSEDKKIEVDSNREKEILPKIKQEAKKTSDVLSKELDKTATNLEKAIDNELQPKKEKSKKEIEAENVIKKLQALMPKKEERVSKTATESAKKEGYFKSEDKNLTVKNNTKIPNITNTITTKKESNQADREIDSFINETNTAISAIKNDIKAIKATQEWVVSEIDKVSKREVKHNNKLLEEIGKTNGVIANQACDLDKVKRATAKLIKLSKDAERKIKEIEKSTERNKDTVALLKRTLSELKKAQSTAKKTLKKQKVVAKKNVDSVKKSNVKLITNATISKEKKSKKNVIKTSGKKDCYSKFINKFPKTKIFRAEVTQWGYRSPDLGVKPSVKIKKGKKIVADKFTNTGWVHIKGTRNWVKGYKLLPPFEVKNKCIVKR